MTHVPQVKKDKITAKVKKELTQFYRRLMMFESYAMLNYTGFSKILKKHDKVVGITTKDKFLKEYVDDKPFHHHTELKELKDNVEVC